MMMMIVVVVLSRCRHEQVVANVKISDHHLVL